MLKVENLYKSFSGFKAVNGANLDVKKGEIVAVIGPNGAGKTTLFNLVTGILRPDAGKVRFREEEITGMPPHEVCRRGLSRSFQVVNVFSRLNVFENVRVAVLARTRKTWNMFTPSKKLAGEETERIIESVGLAGREDRISALLSHGERKVLEIAIALGGAPEFLILDEPTAGMSPDETGRCIELIRKLSKELGLTMLFCEHDMELVFSIADRIMAMVRGATVVQGKCDEVRQNQAVQDAYLGGSGEC